ncbi:MAG TPA: DUF4342 domain-containing protein [Candidatus Paceibacterota bacterium]|nr:DUF4342 domain-containing protein [Candidatus Paceibacterota bacterium]
MATEEFKINGEELLAKVKELVRQGNIRRISIKNEKGESILEIPLTVGAIGVIIAPVLAAVGAAAAMLTKCSIVVEKK